MATEVIEEPRMDPGGMLQHYGSRLNFQATAAAAVIAISDIDQPHATEAVLTGENRHAAATITLKLYGALIEGPTAITITPDATQWKLIGSFDITAAEDEDWEFYVGRWSHYAVLVTTTEDTGAGDVDVELKLFR